METTAAYSKTSKFVFETRDEKASIKNKLLEFICVVGLVIAYLSHLGYLPLDFESDESRRAVVTAEMMISHNYVTPTINAEVYLNKPPLYNWIVAGYFKLFGNYSMFAFRLQVIVAVFAMGLLIYFFTRKYTNHVVAFFTPLAYMSNGRLLIYESLYGYIDTTFALAVYANMMLIFYFGEKKKYYALFISSYTACAVAFLLKGLPAIAFQGITLVTYFILKKDFKKLFRIPNFVGLAIFILLLGAYYASYFSKNHFSPEILFANIFHESAQRTFIQYGFGATLKHAGTFPFEMFYHFLPWTIFLIACFKKNFLRLINENRFIQYTFWIFIANIPVYWFSVDVYPKYVFMFVPLAYGIALYFYFNLNHYSWQRRVIDLLMIFCCIVMLLASVVVPFTTAVAVLKFPFIQIAFLIAAFGACVWLAFKRNYVVYAFLVAIILARISFNWFVLPHRAEKSLQAKNAAQKIVNITKDKPLYILNDADTRNFDGFSFNIETARNEILKKSSSVTPGNYYIVDINQLKRSAFTVDMSFQNLPDHNTLYLVHRDNVLTRAGE
jgi:4-amino-4-deoxy-L-arabinose transferase-like glycosyltransferase